MSGYYVMGRVHGQSVAWCATEAEAEVCARKLNLAGGDYHVEPAAARASIPAPRIVWCPRIFHWLQTKFSARLRCRRCGKELR